MTSQEALMLSLNNNKTLKETDVGKLIVSNHNTQRYWESSLGGYGYPFNYVTHWQPIVIPKKEDI